DRGAGSEVPSRAAPGGRVRTERVRPAGHWRRNLGLVFNLGCELRVWPPGAQVEKPGDAGACPLCTVPSGPTGFRNSHSYKTIWWILTDV
ncbi:hypothetical protein LEMLEM_LOCUS11156, partial [Lemmus lemmus]